MVGRGPSSLSGLCPLLVVLLWAANATAQVPGSPDSAEVLGAKSRDSMLRSDRAGKSGAAATLLSLGGTVLPLVAAAPLISGSEKNGEEVAAPVILLGGMVVVGQAIYDISRVSGCARRPTAGLSSMRLGVVPGRDRHGARLAVAARF